MASKVLKTWCVYRRDVQVFAMAGVRSGAWVEGAISALGLEPAPVFPALTRGCDLVSESPGLKQGFRLEIRAFGGGGGARVSISYKEQLSTRT